VKTGEVEIDERLLIREAQRDRRRFAELYERNFDRVYAYVARRVRDRGDVQDLTSEVFQQALRNLGRFEWRGVPFAAWLYRIAANAIADHYHRRAREEQLAEGADPPQHDDLEHVEARARLYQMVRTLPPDQRLVIERRFSDQRRIREIAAEMGRTEGAVKQLQLRALQTLRAHLDETDG
jgi:RNA polymerase sigma-70 factor (ECF subfamily)